MRYNRYAMPVHPKVLEKDFENTVSIDTLSEIYETLKGKSLSSIDSKVLKEITIYLEKAWNKINYKKGINLRDREKLAPVFLELNRMLYGRKRVPYAYRGARLSSALDINAISRTYPNSINEPEVLEHLESLAYGLRSWSEERETAEYWAAGEEYTAKDKIVFKIRNPKVVLDSVPVLEMTMEFDTYILDTDEVVLYIKNPKILDISQDKNIDNLYYVEVKDMG
jgi:hypothetical protein